MTRVSLFLILAAVTLMAVTAADPHQVISSFSSDLPYDNENRLSSHVLVYEDSPACMARGVKKVKYSDRFIVASVEGEALEKVFGSEKQLGCRAACIDRGVERSLVGNVMPHKHYDPSSKIGFSTWFKDSCTAIEACFLNYQSESTPLEVYWVNDAGEKTKHFDLSWGDRHTKCFHTFLGHRFQVFDGESKDMIGDVTMEYVSVIPFGDSPPSDVRTNDHNFDAEIEKTLHSEWKRHKSVSRTFSPLGFKKGKLPPDVFASLGSFYYNNRGNIVHEEWKNKGVFVNWWETDVLFIQIPWELKGLYQKRLKDMVEEWAGVPIEQTVMYGLRQYTSGARLLTHVDRRPTHAVSLIVNIAQGNLTEPWPVEVQDHMDRLHEVTLSPGEIVFYESAKCLHARNRPLTGPNSYYVNLFTHYRPLDDPAWSDKPNPEGTADAVMEAEGTCQLKGAAKKNVAAGPEYGMVQCDDKRLGQHVSPTLFQAEGPEDLIEWWRMTAPDYVEEDNDSSTNEF